MSRTEYVSPEGLRIDGRRAGELRNIRCRLGLYTEPDGSAYFEQGNTKVVVAVFGPRETDRKSETQTDKAVVTCEYSMAPFSTGERKRRSKQDRRSAEIAMIIRQTFESAILTHLFPRSQINIYLQVIQSDGGTRSACINAASLALMDAGIPMKDFLCSCAACYIDGTPLLDANYIEESSTCPTLTLSILPKSEKIVTAQMDSKVAIDIFEKLLQLALDGSKQIAEILREKVREHAAQLANSRGLMTF
mmetsp:Transcript_24172/g.39711  ORF Transcript_24172/g.39711 Transcript_24172/m.39711 type:complete len:248 (-) Transcript_24172:730-1473(-)